MKRAIYPALVLLLCLCLLAGCENEPRTTDTVQTTEVSAPAADAPIDMDAFLTELTAAHPGASTEELCGAILESPYFTMFNLESTEYYYPGIQYEYVPHDIRAASCAVDFLTGSGALVYVIEPESGADAEALAAELKAHADLNWMFSENAPDQLMTKVLDGKIFLAMYRCDMKPVTGPVAATARDFVGMFHDFRAEQPEADCLAMTSYFAAHQKLTGMETYSVAPGSLSGFGDLGEQTEIGGFADGACFCPTISPNAFIGYVFRLADGADQEAFVAMLKENANLAWNVCVEANTVITETDGSYVLFMMCSE